ncbi:MAG: hypothetical protein HYT14_00105 [Candidatus Liptonbacteria bacterium]|nr:hypothetical protein [Candidatus Liptonbacteria bacterium]
MPPDKLPGKKEELPAHKDRYGGPCRDQAQRITGGNMERRCLGCGRIESYEPDTLIVVFKKGVKVADAIAYVSQFKMNGRQPRLGGKVEKDGIVAVIVSISLAATEALEDWAKALEEPPQGRTTPVWFASRVMKTDFDVAKRASTI